MRPIPAGSFEEHLALRRILLVFCVLILEIDQQ